MKKKATKNLTEGSSVRQENPLPEFALQLQGVSFSYEDGAPKALNNVSLNVKRGEFLAVLGHNGSGKSTLAKLICGLLTADTGRVTVWGFDPADRDGVNEVRQHAGVVFQNPDNQTVASIVEDDVAFGPENLGVNPFPSFGWTEAENSRRRRSCSQARRAYIRREYGDVRP